MQTARSSLAAGRGPAAAAVALAATDPLEHMDLAQRGDCYE